jgi:transposase
MMFAAAVGHRSGRATPSLRDAPQRQSMEIVGRETIYRDRNAVQTNPATSVRRPRVALITRSERRRQWSIEQKQEIVAESLRSDTTPTKVARKYAISSGLLYAWRQQLLHAPVGQLMQSTPSFAQVEIAATPPEPTFPDCPAAAPIRTVATMGQPRSEGLIEIVLPQGVTLRVDAQVDGGALRRVLGVLESR